MSNTANSASKNNTKLKEQVSIINISLIATFFIILSIMLSSIALNKSRVQMLDKINGTNSAKKLPETAGFQNTANIIALGASLVFFYFSWQGMMDKSVRINQQKVNYNNFLASGLVVLATFIRYVTLVRNPGSATGLEEEETV